MQRARGFTLLEVLVAFAIAAMALAALTRPRRPGCDPAAWRRIRSRRCHGPGRAWRSSRSIRGPASRAGTMAAASVGARWCARPRSRAKMADHRARPGRCCSTSRSRRAGRATGASARSRSTRCASARCRGRRGDVNRAGFTLLELLVAIAVFGLLLVGLTEGARFGLGVAGRQAAMSGGRGELDAVDRTLRRVVAEADPEAPFRGTGGTLALTSTLPEGAGLGGAEADIGVGLDGRHRLLLRWTPHQAGRPLRPPPRATRGGAARRRAGRHLELLAGRRLWGLAQRLDRRAAAGADPAPAGVPAGRRAALAGHRGRADARADRIVAAADHPTMRP